MRCGVTLLMLTALWAPSALGAEPEPKPEASLTPSAGVTLSSSPRTGFGLQLGVAVAAGVVSVPVGLALGSWVGSLSNSLLASALPTLLCMGLIAPTAVTLAAWLIGNAGAPGRFPFWVPWAGSVVVNAIALVVAGFAGFSFGVPLQVFVFSLIEGALLGGATTGAMRLFERPPPEAQSVLPSFSPGIGSTHLVALSRISF